MMRRILSRAAATAFDFLSPIMPRLGLEQDTEATAC